MTVRAFAAASILGASLWLALEALRFVGFDVNDPLLLSAGAIVPGFAAFHLHALGRWATTPSVPAWVPIVLPVGAVALSLGTHLERPLWAIPAAALYGAAAIVYAVAVMKAAPKQTLRTDDPLSKGDDACMKHVVFSHRFLAIAAVFLAVAPLVALTSPVFGARLAVTAHHILLVGFGLLSAYGIAHLWIPRFSGVPAIAAGAIKGELHTTLLGLTGLIIGFLTGISGIVAGLGFFVFVGFFTFMGVLGANMMRNKSTTHRVTPEFIYIPWTFTAIFWLISAVLMGLFLNVVPDVFAHRFVDLRSVHVTTGLVGGFIQLMLGLLTRILPMEAGQGPPRFQGALRGAFFAFNGGLSLWIWGSFAGSILEPIGLALVAVSLPWFTQPFAKLMRRPLAASA